VADDALRPATARSLATLCKLKGVVLAKLALSRGAPDHLSPLQNARLRSFREQTTLAGFSKFRRPRFPRTASAASEASRSLAN